MYYESIAVGIVGNDNIEYKVNNGFFMGDYTLEKAINRIDINKESYKRQFGITSIDKINIYKKVITKYNIDYYFIESHKINIKL